MKAYQLVDWHRHGELVDVPQPDPGPGEVVVRVGGAGACHSDLHLMDDFDAGTMPWAVPFTLGHENAGWVAAMGPGVTGLEVDEPVAVYGPWGCGRCRRCVAGLENYCERQAEIGVMGGGLGRNGGMAPYLLVPSVRFLAPLGDLDPVEAAPLTDAGLTPYHAIKRSLGVLTPGSVTLVTGAAGGLGHLAVQILRLLSPTTVIAVERDASAAADAVDLGAHHGLAADEAADAIPQLTHGGGVDFALDLVGTDATLALAGAVTRPLGHLTIVGLGAGTLPVGFFAVGYEVSVATTYWGSRPELDEVLDLARTRGLRARVQRYSLDEAGRAYDAMRANSRVGRAVIVPTASP